MIFDYLCRFMGYLCMGLIVFCTGYLLFSLFTTVPFLDILKMIGFLVVLAIIGRIFFGRI